MKAILESVNKKLSDFTGQFHGSLLLEGVDITSVSDRQLNDLFLIVECKKKTEAYKVVNRLIHKYN